MRSAVLIVLVATSCSRTDAPGPPSRLRLGTSWGINEPTARSGGTVTIALLDLLALPASEKLDVVDKFGDQVLFRPRVGTAIEWAPYLASYQFKSARVEGDVIVASFVPPLPSIDEIYLDGLGPFEVTTFAADSRLVLHRKLPTPRKIETIEVANFPSEEEVWRRFLVNEVDIVPLGSITHLKRLEALPSVRIATVATTETVALRLNMRSSKLADPNVRNALGLVLKRASIAQAATGSSDHAIVRPEDEKTGARVLAHLNLHLRVLYLPAETNAMQGLLAIDRQWSSVGVTVEFVAMDPKTAATTLKTDQHDAWIFFGGLEPTNFRMFLSDSDGNFDGYTSPEFDRAVAQNDVGRAKEILEVDVPAIPLYRVPTTYAYHSRFCNVRPIKTSDLTWLADVRLCAPGERD